MNITHEENTLTYEIYTSLRQSVGWNNWSREQTVNALENSYYTVTAFDKSKAVGMGRVVGDGMYFTIVDVVVMPEYQGKNIGSSIIKSILDHIENDMPGNSRVSIQLISEAGKEEFYIKQGFKLIPHEHCGPALRKIIYK